MNRISAVATLSLSLIGVAACGEATSGRVLSGAGISAGGGAVGAFVVPALSDGAAIGTEADDVPDPPTSMNRMHIGKPRGQTK